MHVKYPEIHSVSHAWIGKQNPPTEVVKSEKCPTEIAFDHQTVEWNQPQGYYTAKFERFETFV